MNVKEPLILVLLGSPGSGKGTQAELISQSYSIPHISTGDLFRREIQKQSPLSRELLSYISQGSLVPDNLVIKTITSILSSNEYPFGYILDGFPRTLPQAKNLNYFLNEQGKKYLVLNFAISQDIVINRLISRLNCNFCKKIFQKNQDLSEGSLCPNCLQGKLFSRDDDNPQTIANRLEIYKKQTEPIELFYKSLGILKNINAQKSPKEIFEEIKQTLPF